MMVRMLISALLLQLVVGTAHAGIVEGNIEAAVLEIISNLKQASGNRVGVELSQSHRDYINASDRKRIVSLVERSLSQEASGSYQLIARSSVKEASQESKNTNASFEAFVQQQQIDTVIRINIYDDAGGLKFYLEAAPYAKTTLISASNHHILIDSVEELNRFSPTRAMQMVAQQLMPYLIDRTDLAVTTPFAVKASESKQDQEDDKLETYLRDRLMAEVSILWEKRYEQKGYGLINDSKRGGVEIGPWSVIVKTTDYADGISAQIQLIRDGYVQTARVIEIDKAQLDPSFLVDALPLVSAPQNFKLTFGTKLVNLHAAGQPAYRARGRAKIGKDLIEKEAITSAKLLARARVIAAALKMQPPHLGLVRETKQVPQLLRYLNYGLPHGENWSIRRNGNLIEVESDIKILALPKPDLNARMTYPVLKSGDPLEMSVLSPKGDYFGLFGWQADGTVIRIFPFKHSQQVRLNTGKPTTLPAKQYGLAKLTSMPFEGANSNHEALVLITSPTPLNLGRMAKRVARKNENYLTRGHKDTQFFDMLALQLLGRKNSTYVEFLPFQVVK